MDVSMAPRWSGVRRGWLAFCSGWWLAGIVFGLRHFVEVWTRPNTPLVELVGVPFVAGGFLPGAIPFYAAADLRSVTGLPTGFTGILVGAVIGLTVWISLPVVVYRDRVHTNRDVPRRDLIVAAIPFAAAGSGLSALSESFRSRGANTLLAAGNAIAAAVIAYLAGAALVFVFGIVYFSS